MEFEPVILDPQGNAEAQSYENSNIKYFMAPICKLAFTKLKERS